MLQLTLKHGIQSWWYLVEIVKEKKNSICSWQRKRESEEVLNKQILSLFPWRHSKPYVWVLCSLSRAARWMGKQANFPNPAQPHGTGSVCTAVWRNTGNRGNSIIASCTGVPPPPTHPPLRARHSLHAKGSTAYLSWLNEDGGNSHTLDLHWESAE